MNGNRLGRVDGVDVLVVGLGPGGACAAAVAASKGLRVLAIDKRRRPGHPVQCAELVPRAMGAYVRAHEVQVQRTEAMETSLPCGAKTTVQQPGLVVDRRRFDQALAARAAAHGAELRFASALLSVDPENCRAAVRAPTGDSYPVSYRLLIAADGPRSRVAASLGLPELYCLYALQHTLRLGRPSTVCRVFLGRHYGGGYGWVFPRGSDANVGVGVAPGSGPGLRFALNRLLSQRRELLLPETAVPRRTGGLIPTSGLRNDLHHGRVMFVGDAAGCTHPISGAGIHPAVTSGEVAGAAAAGWLSRGPAALEEYDEEMRDLFGPSHRHAQARQRLLHSALEHGSLSEDQCMRLAWIGFPEYYSLGAVAG